MLQICDKVDFKNSQREMTPEGFMRVPATLSRCGVYDYTATACASMPNMTDIRKELGLKASEPLKVYRSPDEVFDAESMASFSSKPVTNNHPPEWITAKNAKYYTIGHAGETIVQDGIYQKANLIITDADTIQAIEDGKKEISNGYETDVVKSLGVTDSGEAYHAKFINIRGNHIAIVSKGRAGNGCRISDSKLNGDKHMKTIVIDSVDYEVPAQVGVFVGKLKDDTQKVQDALTDAKSELVTKVATMQAEIDAEKQKVVDAEAKVVDGAKLDAMIEARTALVVDAKTLVEDFDATGKTEAQIVEEVVVAVCDGIEAVLDGKEAGYKTVYCRARFDAALSAKATEPDGSEKVKIGDAEDEDEDAGEKARQKFMKKDKTKTKED